MRAIGGITDANGPCCFLYLRIEFLPVREDRQNDLYFFSRNIRFVIIVIWLPSARESRRDFVYLCNKTI